MWRVTGPKGSAVIKQHAGDRAFVQERTALVGMYLEGLTPRLLEHDAANRVLVLEHLAGGPCELESSTTIHHRAGVVLSQLHACASPSDPMDLSDAIGARLDTALAGARPFIPGDLLAAAESWRDRIDLFVGEPRVSCHRDFAPYNWLRNGDQVGVVDFEHARPDHWLVDLVKLHTSIWRGGRGLRDAFLLGYGRDMDPSDHQRLELLSLLHGLVTTGWGNRHGDDELATHGRELLRWILENPDQSTTSNP